jgi:hypothetical protein
LETKSAPTLTQASVRDDVSQIRNWVETFITHTHDANQDDVLNACAAAALAWSNAILSANAFHLRKDK